MSTSKHKTLDWDLRPKLPSELVVRQYGGIFSGVLTTHSSVGEFIG